MYQGKNRTARASQKQIGTALIALMKVKPYENISVAELCRQAGVSRQTFYSLFHEKQNVLIYLLQENYTPTPPGAPGDGENDLQQMCREYGRYVTEHRELLRLLADNQSLGLTYGVFSNTFKRDSRAFSDLKEEYREYVDEFLCAGITRMTELFVRQERDARAIERIMYGLLRGDCKK